MLLPPTLPLCDVANAQIQAVAAADDDGGDSGDGVGGRSFVLRLSNEGAVTSASYCGRLERARREKAAALRFRASVFVNGSRVRDRRDFRQSSQLTAVSFV